MVLDESEVCMDDGNLTGWGRFPRLGPLNPVKVSGCSEIVKAFTHHGPCIPRGLGRSYGDSSLSKSRVLITTSHNKILDFNSESGLLKVQSGISFDELLKVFVPKGFFLPVVPGTKYVTVGGAVASNIHGKNHHKVGSFCDHVMELNLIDPLRGPLLCSPQVNKDIFYATCGGMGLTGVIDSVTFQLKRIKTSRIRVTEKRASSLKDCMDLFEKHGDREYSVAWVDGLARGKNQGRSVFMLGQEDESKKSQFSENSIFEKADKPHEFRGGRFGGELKVHRDLKLVVPCFLPDFFLNPFLAKFFNAFYYTKRGFSLKSFSTHYDSYFFPLDFISHWNRIYGKKGFMQYQFVVPLEKSYEAVDLVLRKVSKAGGISFLSVLKKFGPQSDSYLNFPVEGYTLTMDFKCNRKNFNLLNRLDEVVLMFGGRTYLTKDSRMSKVTFDKMYGIKAEKFRQLRKQMGWDRFLSSEQSKRLEL